MAHAQKKDPFSEVQKMHLLHQAQILALVATFEQAGFVKLGHYKANVLALAEAMRGTPDYEIGQGLVEFAALLTKDPGDLQT